MLQKSKAEILHLNNILKLVMSLILAGGNTLQLKQVNLSSYQMSPAVSTDIYNLMKTFIHEVIQKVNEYQSRTETLQAQLKGKTEEQDLFLQYRQKATQQEEELKYLKQQNSILMNVIKEMKQISQATPLVPKFLSKDCFNDIPTEKINDTQIRDDCLKINLENGPKDISLRSCNAERILINLNKKIESLMQRTEADQEGEYRVQKLEGHLKCLKERLLHQLQEKLSDIEKKESDQSGETRLSDVRMLLLEEKINQLSSDITSEVASGKEVLRETLNEIKAEMASLQQACQNFHIISKKHDIKKDECETGFRNEGDSEKLKQLEEKVHKLELYVQQKIQTKQESQSAVLNNAAPLHMFDIPTHKAVSPHFQHFKENKHPISYHTESKLSHDYFSEKNKTSENEHKIFESANCLNKQKRSDTSTEYYSNDPSEMEDIWAELNEEYIKELLN